MLSPNESPSPEQQAELARICRAVEIASPRTFYFAGSLFEASVEPGAAPEGPPALPRLLQLLYEHCYARRFDESRAARAAGGSELVAGGPPEAAFVRRLVDANPGRERYDADWRVEGIAPDRRLTARKGAAIRTFAPGRYFPSGSLQRGATIGVWLAKGSLRLQPGFYHVFGEILTEGDDPRNLVRLYWNLRPEGAPRLLAELTGRLNRFQIPFHFKTLTHPGHYRQRSDGSVLYLDRRHFAIALKLYSQIAGVLAAELGDEIPLFTKPLGRGLGLAEDPGDGDSFGLSRCRLLAGALFAAHSRGVRGEARLYEVAAFFAAHGISLARPYLNPRSADRYPAMNLHGEAP